MHHRFVWLTLAASLTFATTVGAAKPEAWFEIDKEDKNWLQFGIEQDGKPVNGARVEIIDAVGNQWAQGETSAAGGTSLPKPRGQTFRVLVTINDKSCDSVLVLYGGPKGVLPDRVQLTFGDRSCCRTTGHTLSSFAFDEADEEPPPPPRRIWPFVAAGGVCLGAAALVLAFSRRPPAKPSNDDAT